MAKARDTDHRVHRITLALSSFPMTDKPKMTFVSSCRLSGRTLFILERFNTNLSGAEIVQEKNGPIPAFLSEENARAEIARRFPLPRVAVTDKSSFEELAGAMEDHYAKWFKFFYDLDAAGNGPGDPGPSGLSPKDALQVWELLFQVDEAPRPQRFDPMKMFAMYENIMKDPANRDGYELVLLGMKLSGIVVVSQEARKTPDWDMEFPDMGEIWPKTDYPRLGEIFRRGSKPSGVESPLPRPEVEDAHGSSPHYCPASFAL